MNRVCLNMIVRDESAVIERAFKSAVPLISTFLIVDTGSTDNTIELINSLSSRYSIPGKVVSRPWVDFGTNRQEAMDLAIAENNSDWLLFLDADEEFVVTRKDVTLILEPGKSYKLYKNNGNLKYAVSSLVDISKTRWLWREPLHEYIAPTSPIDYGGILEDVAIFCHRGEGFRSKKKSERERFLEDAAVFEKYLEKEPNNVRSVFYLAQSYRDAGEPLLAFNNYEKRVSMGGWDEEIFYSLFEVARISIQLNRKDIIDRHLAAWEYRPKRAEPLWHLGRYLRLEKHFARSYIFSKIAKDILEPDDLLFINKAVYDWMALDEFSIVAYWIGKYKESLEACQKLLDERKFPDYEKKRIIENYNFAKAKV